MEDNETEDNEIAQTSGETSEPEKRGNLVVQKDDRSKIKKRKGWSVKQIMKRDHIRSRRKRKRAQKGKRSDPFPEYTYHVFKHQVRQLSEDPSQEEIISHSEAKYEKVLVLKHGHPNLPTRRGVQIGLTRGNGKTFVASKGRIVTRRKPKRKYGKNKH